MNFNLFKSSSELHPKCFLIYFTISLAASFLKNFEPKFNTYPYYIIFVTFFAVIAEILNITFGSNLMMLSNPYKIPIVLIQQISQAYPYFYTFIAYLCYILLYGVICLVFLLFNKQKGE